MEKAVTYLRTRGVKITRKPAKLATSLCAEVEDPDGLSIELRQWLKQGVASKVILRSETTKNPLSDGDSRDSSLRSE